MISPTSVQIITVVACVFGLGLLMSNKPKVTKHETKTTNEIHISDPVGCFVVGDLYPLASDAPKPTLSNYL